MNALVRAVDLVDHHDDPVTQLQGAAEHKAGLGHGALGGVHQQDHAVDHLQDALHLAAEVSMARGVHNVDLGVAVLDGGVLGQDGDAPLTLQIVGVHDPLHRLLVLAVHAALLEHLVHQGGLAVVHVGDNGYVSQFFVLQRKNPFLLGIKIHALCGAPRKQANSSVHEVLCIIPGCPEGAREWHILFFAMLLHSKSLNLHIISPDFSDCKNFL